MMLPQEIEVWYILPAVRSALCKELASKLQQKKIAQLLGITEPAVSQYIKGKRGSKLKFDAHIKNEIRIAANELASENVHPMEILNQLSKKVLHTSAICKLHYSMENDVPEDCKVCLQ